MRTLFIVLTSVFIFFGCSKSQENTSEGKAARSEQSERRVVKGDTTITFDDTEAGKMPAGWSNHFTGKGALGKWEIRRDHGNKVLAQVSEKNFGSHFNLAVWDESNARDVEISVRFKGVAGEEDQGGGPVWRFQDTDNYYIARANPLENNFRVYKIVEGNRRKMASANINIPTGEWHTIAIRMAGDHIACSYDGKKYLDLHDDTFKESGKIGLWSKADAVTYFDDVQFSVLQEHGAALDIGSIERIVGIKGTKSTL